MSGPTQRTSIELYRDLLRLIHHIAPGTSPKSLALRTLVRSEFDKSKSLSPSSPSDAIKIESLKANAVRALSNYMLYEGGIQDRGRGGKLGKAMDSFHRRSLDGMNDKSDGLQHSQRQQQQQSQQQQQQSGSEDDGRRRQHDEDHSDATKSSRES